MASMNDAEEAYLGLASRLRMLQDLRPCFRYLRQHLVSLSTTADHLATRRTIERQMHVSSRLDILRLPAFERVVMDYEALCRYAHTLGVEMEPLPKEIRLETANEAVLRLLAQLGQGMLLCLEEMWGFFCWRFAPEARTMQYYMFSLHGRRLGLSDDVQARLLQREDNHIQAASIRRYLVRARSCQPVVAGYAQRRDALLHRMQSVLTLMEPAGPMVLRHMWRTALGRLGEIVPSPGL